MRYAFVVGTLWCVLAGPVVAQSDMSDAPPGGGLRLHVGMWTSHLRDLGRGLENNWLMGVGWRGLYGSTFVNSYGSRAFAFGVEKSMTRVEDGGLDRGLGYRIGLVTGYDRRFHPFADKVPALPIAQLVGDVARGPTSVELAWSGLVASLGPRLRLR